MGDWRVEAVRMKAMCKNDLPCAVISQAYTHIRSHPVINYALKMRSFPHLFYHFTQVSFVPAKVIMNFTLTHLKIETRQKRNEVYDRWTVSNHRGEQHLIIPIREFAWLPPR